MKFRESLFWDTNPDWIDIKKNARYIIERVLDFGELEEVRWLFKTYSKEEIKRVMDLPRSQVTTKSKTLWNLLLT